MFAGTGKPWTLLNQLSTTEFLNYEGTKFSKSNNMGVFGDHAMDTGIPQEVRAHTVVPLCPVLAVFSYCRAVLPRHSSLVCMFVCVRVSQVWRYYLFSVRPEASDSDFNWDDFAGPWPHTHAALVHWLCCSLCVRVCQPATITSC